MRNQLLLLVCFVSMFFAAAAQKGTVNGAIRDEANFKSIAGATITIEGLNRNAVTDTFGRYSFNKLPPGAYTVHSIGDGL